MEHQNFHLVVSTLTMISFKFPYLFCGFSFLVPSRLTVFVNGVFCCEIFSACVTGDMMYLDFKAAANLIITNMLICDLV